MRRREVIAGMLAALGANPAHGQPALDELRSDARHAGFDLSHAELAAIQTYVSDFQNAAERVANAIPPRCRRSMDREIPRVRRHRKIRSTRGM